MWQISPANFTLERRITFAAALAGILGNISSPVIIESVVPIDLDPSSNTRLLGYVNIARRGRQMNPMLATASRITAQVPLAAAGCNNAEAALSPASASLRLEASGFQLAGPISVQFEGCTTIQEALPAALQQHVEATTAVVSVVVAGVVSGSVAAAAAGAIGASFSSTSIATMTSSPGASVYQLISAVQVISEPPHRVFLFQCLHIT